MEISLLQRLVLGKSRLELALFLFFHLDHRLRARQRGGRVIPFLVELRELRVECADLGFDFTDLQIVLLQRKQRLNFL